MPHITVKGIEENVVAQISETLPTALLPIVGGAEQDIFIQYDSVKFYYKGRPATQAPVIVQINTQPRSKDTLDQCAAVITDALKIYTDRNVEVFFVLGSIEMYYRNGKAF